MERVASVEEKIRRAEEIYEKRKQGNVRPVATVNVNDKKDIKYDIMVNAKATERKRVADTDIGKEIQEEINDLKLLLNAYKEGKIKESF